MSHFNGEADMAEWMKTTRRWSRDDRECALARLTNLLKPGDTVHCILRHVSRSGMLRVIGLVVPRNGGLEDITADAAKVLDYTLDRTRWGVKVEGVGMDMGFHVVYSLSHYLFPEGFGLVCERCGDRPTSEAQLVGGRYPCVGAEDGQHKFYGRNGDASGWDNDGGYALKHRWL
jgi:hypothetical protein